MNNESEYEILGSGNFSSTFLKEDQEGKFVLKQIKSKHIKNQKVIQLFQNEGKFNFTRKGLPSNVSYLVQSDKHYITKPFVDGETLEKTKKLKGKQLKTILLNLVDHLIFLEKNGIVHCDIKPSNIIIQENNEVHLIDFGLAQFNYKSNLNFVLFSLGFAAPELILNRRNIIDQRTDIFSFGMLIYFLISKKLPFSDSNPSIFTNLQITHPISSSPKIKKELMAIIQKCCAKYQFKLSPNKYSKEELDKRLFAGMENRYLCFEDLKEDLEKLEENTFQKKPFRF